MSKKQTHGKVEVAPRPLWTCARVLKEESFTVTMRSMRNGPTSSGRDGLDGGRQILRKLALCFKNATPGKRSTEKPSKEGRCRRAAGLTSYPSWKIARCAENEGGRSFGGASPGVTCSGVCVRKEPLDVMQIMIEQRYSVRLRVERCAAAGSSALSPLPDTR